MGEHGSNREESLINSRRQESAMLLTPVRPTTVTEFETLDSLG